MMRLLGQGVWIAGLLMALAGMAGAEAVELRLRFTAGDILYATTHLDVVAHYETYSTEIPSVTPAPATMHSRFIQERRIDVLGQKDGETILRDTLVQLREILENGETVDYIRNGHATSENPLFADLITPLDYRISPTGRVTSLSGLSTRRGLGFWASGVSLLFPHLPEEAVAEGEQWTATDTAPLAVSKSCSDCQAAYRLEKAEPGRAEIAYTMVVASDETAHRKSDFPASATALTAIEWRLRDYRMESSGLHLLDTRTGRLIETTENGTFTAAVRTQSGLKEGPLTLELRQSGTLTRRTRIDYQTRR